MLSDLPYDRRSLNVSLMWGTFLTLILGVFFLGLFLVNRPSFKKLFSPIPSPKSNYEVFGFAPHWTLNKMDNIDWDTLTTFAYFSLPVGAGGSIDKESYEWTVFEGSKLNSLFEKAKENDVRRVVTLTQMERGTIEAFLEDRSSWKTLADESVDILNSRKLDGVNIDFEYVPANDRLKVKFSEFVEFYTGELEAKTNNPYITVSVLASSARFNKIYDIGRLSKATDGIFMMAYDFYYPGSEKVGPSAPLYGYNGGKGPFWYDVSTAVDDFLKVADADKIIMGVPYYGWNYPAYAPSKNSDKVGGTRAVATTNLKADQNALMTLTPVGGWDDNAKVSWRSYWDQSGWRVVYMEDEKSLSLKYDFAKGKNLGGVGIWALGFDSKADNFWPVLATKFSNQYLSFSKNSWAN